MTPTTFTIPDFTTMPWWQILTWVIFTFVVPGLLTWVGKNGAGRLAQAEKLVGLQADATHNQNLTNAVVSFAGQALDGIRAKNYTLDDLKDGHCTADLLAYLNSTVEAAMLHFMKSPADLTTMLVSKVTPMLTQDEITAAATEAKTVLASAAATVGMVGSTIPVSGIGDPKLIQP